MAEPEGRAGRHPTGVGRYSGRAVSWTPGARAGVGGAARAGSPIGRRVPPRAGVGRPARARARRVPCGRRAPCSRARPSGPLRAAGVGCRSGLRRRRLASKGRRLANARPPIFASLTRLVEARFCVAYPPCASASFVRKGNLVCRAVRNYTSLFVIPSVR